MRGLGAAAFLGDILDQLVKDGTEYNGGEIGLVSPWDVRPQVGFCHC